jgi:hypothetical protein
MLLIYIVLVTLVNLVMLLFLYKLVTLMNTTNSIHSQITRKIRRFSKGKPIFPSDFKGMGSEAAIKMALMRLVREGKLSRVAHGIYVIPKESSKFGKIPPSLEEIAHAIAERDHARIRPAGLFALNMLGLSTQVPMKLVYITDGAPRHVKVGKRTIKFKPATPKSLAYKGKISGLVVQALKELGNKRVTEEMISKIKALLRNEKREIIMEDAKLAPYWIAKLFYSTLDEMKKHDRVA